jgi:hypothetical protein
MSRRSRTPEQVGKRLWSQVSLNGSTTPLSQDAFDDVLLQACNLEASDPTRLHYVWHALVALAPGIESLQHCLENAPVGFSPVFQHSANTASVLGNNSAWRAAYVASRGHASAGTARLVLEACGLERGFEYGHSVQLVRALAVALERLDRSMTWIGLTMVLAGLDAAELPWRQVLSELTDHSLDDLIGAWSSLLSGPELLTRAATLRHAGAPGTLAELMLAVPALELA